MSVGGWEGAIRVATTEAGLASASNEAKYQGGDIDYGGGHHPLREVGNRLPIEIKEGMANIKLDLKFLYVAGSAWPTRANVGGSSANTEYYVGVYPKGYATGNPKIVLLGKFGNWGLDCPLEGELMESVLYIGRSIAVGTI